MNHEPVPLTLDSAPLTAKMTVPNLPPPMDTPLDHKRILIVEDEREIAELVRMYLEKEGYRARIAATGQEALKQVATDPPSLVILDLMLAEMDGLEVCRRLRADPKTALIPIIMLTAKTEEADQIVGFELGADDYVTKPFSVRELLARVRAQLRRSEKRLTTEDACRFGAIELNFRKHQAWRNGKPFELSPREFALLKYFLQHRGETVTRDQLLDEVWGYDNFPLTRTVDNHIARLRQKIEENPAEPQYIITVHRVGYKFLG